MNEVTLGTETSDTKSTHINGIRLGWFSQRTSELSPDTNKIGLSLYYDPCRMPLL
ncbi:hypothetical protein MASR2M70_13490 [Bacillota bacterium]